MKRWMKQMAKTMVIASMTAIMMASSAFAAGWVQEKTGNGPGEAGRWWYDLENGQYYAADSAANGQTEARRLWMWSARNGTAMRDRPWLPG